MPYYSSSLLNFMFSFSTGRLTRKTLLCVWHICKMYNYIKFAFVKGLIFKSIFNDKIKLMYVYVT